MQRKDTVPYYTNVYASLRFQAAGVEVIYLRDIVTIIRGPTEALPVPVNGTPNILLDLT